MSFSKIELKTTTTTKKQPTNKMDMEIICVEVQTLSYRNHEALLEKFWAILITDITTVSNCRQHNYVDFIEMCMRMGSKCLALKFLENFNPQGNFKGEKSNLFGKK